MNVSSKLFISACTVNYLFMVFMMEVDKKSKLNQKVVTNFKGQYSNPFLNVGQ